MNDNTITKGLPEPLIKVEYKVWRRAHLYLVGGKKYPSVTKILSIIDHGKSNALTIWARREAIKLAKRELLAILDKGAVINHEAVDTAMLMAEKQPDRLKDAAADIGTRIHNAIDAYIAGTPCPLDVDAQKGFDNFMSWLRAEEMELIAGDTVVASVDLGFGGRLDALARNKDGKLVLLDWKTSNALRDEYPLQVAAYAKAFKETYGLDISEAVVVRFGKENAEDFEPRRVNIPAAWKAFEFAVGLTDAMEGALWA